MVQDIRDAADVLRPVYEATGGADGFVSIEVTPTKARDTHGTMVEARDLWKRVGRPNLMVKIPGTVEGLPAIRQMIREGININVTLLFSLERYLQVAEVYCAGLEERVADGLPVDRVASVASVFVSRIDTMVDELLQKLASAPAGDRIRRGRSAGNGRGGKREDDLPGLRVDVHLPAVPAARRKGRPRPAAPLGEHGDQEPGLPRPEVC